MNLASSLMAARDKIAYPANWTQGTPARDCIGKPVHFTKPWAVMFSAAGALGSVCSKFINGQFLPLPESICDYALVGRCADVIEQVTSMALNDFNDSHSHGEMLAAFDHAIQKLTGTSP